MGKIKRPARRRTEKGADVKKTDTPKNHNTPAPEPEETAPRQSPKDRTPKQSTLILAIVDEEIDKGTIELFHDGEHAFAIVDFGDHHETMRLRSSFRRWMNLQYYTVYKTAPSESAMQEALGVLEGCAIYHGDEYRVHIRLAEHEGHIYLDLANEKWEAVKIGRDGWEVIADPPVRFARPPAMKGLPAPESGGDLGELGKFVNVRGDNLVLVVSWLLGTLHPRGPYSTLVLVGREGAAKSTAARVLRRLVDPNKSEIRKMPRREDDVIIAAYNGYIVTFDNVSKLHDRLADTICGINTGTGLSTRKLYTNFEEAVIENVRRPVMLNSIGHICTKGDLLQRSLVVELDQLKEWEEEEEFYTRFEAARPRLFGALLDAAAAAKRGLPSAKVPGRRIRMADFARWVIAAEVEGALPWERGTFEKAYTKNRGEVVNIVLNDPVAEALCAMMQGCDRVEATPTGLLEKLVGFAGDRARSDNWPKSPAALTQHLEGIASALQQRDGIHIGHQRSGRARKTVIERVEKEGIG